MQHQSAGARPADQQRQSTAVMVACTGHDCQRKPCRRIGDDEPSPALSAQEPATGPTMLGEGAPGAGASSCSSFGHEVEDAALAPAGLELLLVLRAQVAQLLRVDVHRDARHVQQLSELLACEACLHAGIQGHSSSCCTAVQTPNKRQP